jgi:hypothetical protein
VSYQAGGFSVCLPCLEVKAVKVLMGLSVHPGTSLSMSLKSEFSKNKKQKVLQLVLDSEHTDSPL